MEYLTQQKDMMHDFLEYFGAESGKKPDFDVDSSDEEALPGKFDRAFLGDSTIENVVDNKT